MFVDRAQQEPKNMGAWNFVKPRFDTAVDVLCKDLPRRKLAYVGRGVAASPATGLFRLHQKEQRDMLDQVFTYSHEP